MKRILVVVALVAVTGCSSEQLAAWVAWHEQDPQAAVEFAQRPEITAALERDEPAVAWSVNWDRVSWCESGSNWAHRPVTNSSGTYSGGLMIGHRWWPLYGGREFAAYPYQASKAQQVTVAERIVDDIGFDRGWQCPA